MEKVIEIGLKMILNVRPKYKRRMELFVFCASIVYFHHYKDKYLLLLLMSVSSD